MNPHNRVFDPNNPWAYQETPTPSPPSNRPIAPFLIHSAMPDMADYASLISNRLYTNFPHTNHSIPSPIQQNYINLSQTETVAETVPETQPPIDGSTASKPIKKRSHKKKTESEKAIESAKGKQQKWVLKEEVALARAWFQQSLHSVLGNSQHRNRLWDAVSKAFHEEMERELYRENDSLSSKWTEISGQLTKFSGFLNKERQNPKSGETEADFVTNALVTFKSNLGSDFGFMHCWEICKFHPKWANIPGGCETTTSSKRARTPSSQAQSNARDQEFDYKLDESPNRPEFGRVAAKRRAQKSRSGTPSPLVGSSGLRRGVYNDQLEDIASKLDTFNVFQQQRAEIRKSKEVRDALKQRQDYMKFLAQPTKVKS